MLKEHVYEEKITNAAEKPLSHINNLHNIRLCNPNPFLDCDIAFANSKLAMGLSCLAIVFFILLHPPTFKTPSRGRYIIFAILSSFE